MIVPVKIFLKFLPLVFIILSSGASSQVSATDDYLGKGLFILNIKEPFINTDSAMFILKDTHTPFKEKAVPIKETNCPACIMCAEPARFYRGSIHPYICGSGMIAFICIQHDSLYNTIYIDSLYTEKCISNRFGAFYSWNDFFVWQGKQGHYMTFTRQWDSTVLYDKPYDIKHLPPSHNLQTGLHLKDVDNLRFFPVAIQGYWMKMRIVRRGKAIGYCWVIWRDDKKQLIAFAFNAE